MRGGALAAVARPLAGKGKTIDGRNPHDARNYAPLWTVGSLYELMTERARARAQGVRVEQTLLWHDGSTRPAGTGVERRRMRVACYMLLAVAREKHRLRAAYVCRH